MPNYERKNASLNGADIPLLSGMSFVDYLSLMASKKSNFTEITVYSAVIPSYYPLNALQVEEIYTDGTIFEVRKTTLSDRLDIGKATYVGWTGMRDGTTEPTHILATPLRMDKLAEFSHRGIIFTWNPRSQSLPRANKRTSHFNL